MRKQFRLKSPLAAAVLTLGLLAPSCVGPFNTWHQVLHWNRSVSDSKWAAEGLFILCWIIPVYPIATLADVIVFNSLEFWGADNPIPPATYTSGQGVTEMEASTTPDTIEVAPACSAD